MIPVRLLVVLALLTGCATAPASLGEDDITLASALVPFDDCDALTGRIREHALEQAAAYGMAAPAARAEGADMRATTGDAAAPAAQADGAAGAEAAGGAFSGTNVQEAGVDEGDLVKTDGDWLYTVADGTTMWVVDVRGDEPSVAARLPLGESTSARELLLVGDRLLIVGDSFTPLRTPDPAASGGGDVPPDVTADTRVADIELLPMPQHTKLWLVDVADPARPEVLSSMTVEGGTVATRLTDDTARVVLRSSLMPPPMELPSDGGAGEQRRAADVNRERIRRSVAEDWLPLAQVDEAGAEPLVDCQRVYEPRGFRDLGMVTVLSLDLTRPSLDADRAEAVLGGADTVYATDEHLYVTTSRWPFGGPGMPIPVEPMPMPEPRALPDAEAAPAPPSATVTEPQPSAPAELASPVEPEPQPTIGEPTPSLPEPSPDVVEPAPPENDASAVPAPRRKTDSMTTEVHRFDLVDAGAEYVASGSVPGRVLNQWAMSEHEGDLRIATTEGEFSADGRTHSSVRILRERDGRLRTIGRVRDLGKGEQIYAVRYAGDIGFVVTFRQIDPLYTLDLSDPTEPRMVGELKVPGYSAYLHPVDADHLLGIGQNATTEGQTTGVQASLFDVADLAEPRRVAQLALGRDTMTDVEYDHRAFLYWPEEQMAVLPLADWQPGGKVGAVVLHVAPGDELVERGFIEHPPHEGAVPPVQRALVVDDRIITVTYAGVQATDLATLEPLGDAAFVR